MEILNQGIWHTYWHDGTNKGVSVKARVSARAGTGVVGFDYPTGPVHGLEVHQPCRIRNRFERRRYFPGHGLRSGFVVRIFGARGRKTNEAKDQVDEDGNVTAQRWA